jgi:hypothetical protein
MPGMEKKNGFAVAESDRRLIRNNAYFIREALFSCMTEAQVECSVAFARFLNRFGLNQENYWLFLRLVMTNNPWVIDELLHEREARFLFSTIRPEAELIDGAFQILFSRHPEELYPKALEALLGIVESAYFDPDDGYRIRKLTIMDINALGKFLLKGESQEHPLNRLILDILDRMTHINEYYQEPDKSVLSKHAFNVRYAYFDRTREMVDAIPQPLLVRVPDHGKVRPEEDYVDLVTKRRARKRDASGRFVREAPPAEAEAISVELGAEPSVSPEPSAASARSATPEQIGKPQRKQAAAKPRVESTAPNKAEPKSAAKRPKTEPKRRKKG